MKNSRYLESAKMHSAEKQHREGGEKRTTNSAKESVSREHVRRVADRVIREHKPALDWLADR